MADMRYTDANLAALSGGKSARSVAVYARLFECHTEGDDDYDKRCGLAACLHCMPAWRARQAGKVAAWLRGEPLYAVTLLLPEAADVSPDDIDVNLAKKRLRNWLETSDLPACQVWGFVEWEFHKADGTRYPKSRWVLHVHAVFAGLAPQDIKVFREKLKRRCKRVGLKGPLKMEEVYDLAGAICYATKARPTGKFRRKVQSLNARERRVALRWLARSPNSLKIKFEIGARSL